MPLKHFLLFYYYGSCLILSRAINSNTSTVNGTNRELVGGLSDQVTVHINSKQYKVLAVYDHDENAFTQGLALHNGFLYESTGLQGKSEIRQVELSTGKVLKKKSLPADNFGEGMTIFDGKIHQITWHNRKGYVWDTDTLEPIQNFQYTTTNGEGWGITSDDSSLILSDGTSYLHFIDPHNMQLTRKVEVKYDGRSLKRLNELEFANGYIFANVWFSDYVYKINPESGNVVEKYDFSELYPAAQRKKELSSREAVLNGIAYDSIEDVFYLTGKLWPRMYKVQLSEN